MAGRATSAVGRVTLYGSNGSPYSIKVRSLMRYRRIAYTWQRLWQWLEDGGSVSEVRAVESQRMPLLRFDDGQLVQGSTNIALDLERRMATLARSVIPRDPATAFLVHLVEDYADEWWMKSAFAWRWILQDEKAVKVRESVLCGGVGGSVGWGLCVVLGGWVKREGRRGMVLWVLCVVLCVWLW